LSEIQRLKAGGVRSVLALRGDKREDAIAHDFSRADELIAFLKDSSDLEICAACYPTKHPESRNETQDFDVAKLKYDLGVRHFISQLFYDNATFYNMLNEFARRGMKAEVDAGIMPITNAKNILRMVTLSGVTLPQNLQKIIEKFQDDTPSLKEACLEFSINQIRELKKELISESANIGIHLYAMNKPDIAKRIFNGI
jgi:methylenetetrahydrofolate reductase (NADPH)